jgi:hypothetical protein
MTSFLRSYGDPALLQQPADVAVVIPSILRSTLVDAVQSVFRQNVAGRIHLLIGVDAPAGNMDLLDEACADRPANTVVQIICPGYSTSERHGGVTPSHFGGSLRCLLSLLANSCFIAYLDDDNWLLPDHLRTLRDAAEKAAWAWSLRWFVHPETATPICIDTWESVGPGRGVFAEKLDGFVDTNCLMLDKRRCESALLGWNAKLPGNEKGAGEDRVVFETLRHLPNVGTGLATACYRIDPADRIHAQRLGFMGARYAAAGAAAPLASADPPPPYFA